MTNASDSRRVAEEVLALFASRLEEVRERAAEDAEWRAADDMGLGAASWHLALPERIEQVHDDRAYLLTVVDALAEQVASFAAGRTEPGPEREAAVRAERAREALSDLMERRFPAEAALSADEVTVRDALALAIGSFSRAKPLTACLHLEGAQLAARVARLRGLADEVDEVVNLVRGRRVEEVS